MNINTLLKRIEDGLLAVWSLIEDYKASYSLTDTGKVMLFPSAEASADVNTFKEESRIVSSEDFEEFKEDTMQGQYANDFITGKRKAHMRKRKDGVYEVRCMIKGVPVCGCSVSEREAMRKFLDAVEKLGANDVSQERNVSQSTVKVKPLTISEYWIKWLETAVKPRVKEISYKHYMNLYENHIKDGLKDVPLDGVTLSQLQAFVDGHKGSVARDVCVHLKSMFRYAVSDGVIDKSPAEAVKAPVCEFDKGVPLTRAEEKELVEKLKANKDNIVLQAYVFIMYTGLRRSELASLERDGNGFRVVCAKTKKGHKDKTRWVPLSPMLAKVLPFIDLDKIKAVSLCMLTNYASKLMNGHHTHELRHTFITRAQECGIRREYVSLWSGHAADNSITTAVYTHLEQNRELQEQAMKAFDYEL